MINYCFTLLVITACLRSMGKVMFSQVFVCSQEVCLLRGVCLEGDSAWKGSRRVCMEGEGGPPPGKDITGYGQQAGGSHPAGMHPCLTRNEFLN